MNRVVYRFSREMDVKVLAGRLPLQFLNHQVIDGCLYTISTTVYDRDGALVEIIISYPQQGDPRIAGALIHREGTRVNSFLDDVGGLICGQ